MGALEDWFDDMLSGLSLNTNEWFKGLEDCSETWFEKFGENITNGADAYKNLVVSEYKKGLKSVKDDYKKCYDKIRDKQRAAKEIKEKDRYDKAIKKIQLKSNDLEKKIEVQYKNKLISLDRAKTKRIEKLKRAK